MPNPLADAQDTLAALPTPSRLDCVDGLPESEPFVRKVGQIAVYVNNASLYFGAGDGDDVGDADGAGWDDSGTALNVKVAIEYFDVGTEAIRIGYTTNGASETLATIVTKTNTKTWKKAHLALSGVKFGTSYYGLDSSDVAGGGGDHYNADFRIFSSGALYLASIAVTNRDTKAALRFPAFAFQNQTSIVSPNSVVGDEIEDATITATQIANATITAAQIANATITGSNIASATIAGSNLVNGTITATQIATGTITANEIANATITGAKIGAGQITGSNIAGGTITASNIATGTITATQIEDLTITAGEIANLTITATQIANATITGAKIANATIAGSNISSATITSSNIAGGTITGSNIAASTITGANISAATITNSLLVDATITGAKIAASTITASNIAAGTITATQIATGTITATQIAAGTITATQLSATAIDSMTITGATIRTASSGARTEMNASNLFGLGFGGVGGYDGSAVQWYAKNSDGKIYAAGGKLVVDATALALYDGSSVLSAYLVGASTTLNGESLVAGDVLFGNNTGTSPNIKISGGEIATRLDTTDKVLIGGSIRCTNGSGINTVVLTVTGATGANQDLDETGFGSGGSPFSTNFVRVASTGNWTLRSIVIGEDGQWLFLINESANNMTISNAGAAPPGYAAIRTFDGTSPATTNAGCALFIYNATNGTWELMSYRG